MLDMNYKKGRSLLIRSKPTFSEQVKQKTVGLIVVFGAEVFLVRTSRQSVCFFLKKS